MREVIRIETSDGVLHKDIATATRHAEERYDSELTRLASRLVRINKYVEFIDFIEKHLDEFVNLSLLKRDIDQEVG
jgi:CRP-like cAMP-binding protein